MTVETWDPNGKCFSARIGIWAVENRWIDAMVEGWRSGALKADAREEIQARAKAQETYTLAPGGVAVIPVVGEIMKADSSFGGTSTIRLRRAIRAATQDRDVAGIMLYVDSPGGTVAGLVELTDDIRAAARAKPVRAHIDDMGASAAYWAAVASGGRLTANQTAMIGSIGTMVVVHDTSARMEQLGVKVHAIGSGAAKGAGVTGTPVSDELLEEIRDHVESSARLFHTAVARGRGVPVDKVRGEWATGRTWPAERARAMGLIDEVTSFESSLSSFRGLLRQRKRLGEARASITKDRIDEARRRLG